MYRAWLDGVLILDPSQNIFVSDPKLKLSDNSAGSFSFVLFNDSPAFAAVNLLKSRVTVARDGQTIFEGRIIEAQKTNAYSMSIEAEGALAYLCDSIQRPAEYHGLSVTGYLSKLIELHNTQVDNSKKFTLGIVNVTDPNDSLYRYTNWESTLDVIKSDLIESLDGHLRIRYANGTRYLDYLAEGGPISTQPISFGDNLLELCETSDALELATVCIPLGERLEKTEDDPQALEKYLTIGSVNNGLDYVEIPAAVAAYGRVARVVKFDKVTDPANLKAKALNWLSSAQYETLELEVKAVDLADLGLSAEPWNLLDRIPCKCAAMGLNHVFMLAKKEIDLIEPAKNVYTLGSSGANFSAQTRAAQSSLEQQIGGTRADSAASLQAAISGLHGASVRFLPSVSDATSLQIGTAKDGTGGGYKWKDSALSYLPDLTKPSGGVVLLDSSGKLNGAQMTAGSVGSTSLDPAWIATLAKKADLITNINAATGTIEASKIDGQAIRESGTPLTWTAANSKLTQTGDLTAKNPAFSGSAMFGDFANITGDSSGMLTLTASKISLAAPIITTAGTNAKTANVIIPNVGTLHFISGLFTGFTEAENVTDNPTD